MREKVLVTGISSFLGYHISCAAVAAGFDVVGTRFRDRSEYSGVRRERVDLLPTEILQESIDLRDDMAVRALIARHSPQFWVHQAGFTAKYFGQAYDFKTGYETNVRPLGRIFRCLKDHGCRGVLLTGSSMEYSDSTDPCRETDVCRPSTPYGRVKLDETIEALTLSRAIGLPVRIARVFIPFGNLDDPGRFVPTVIQAIQNLRPVQLTDGRQKRDFLHVDDVVSGYLCLLNDLSRGGGEVVNVCSSQPISLRDFVALTVDLTGVSPELFHFGEIPMRDSEGPVSVGDSRKLQRLGWRHEGIEDGIRKLLLAINILGAHKLPI